MIDRLVQHAEILSLTGRQLPPPRPRPRRPPTRPRARNTLTTQSRQPLAGTQGPPQRADLDLNEAKPAPIAAITPQTPSLPAAHQPSESPSGRSQAGVEFQLARRGSDFERP